MRISESSRTMTRRLVPACALDTVSFAADATDVVYAERQLLQRYDAALHALGAASM
jgi:hypothetical protein